MFSPQSATVPPRDAGQRRGLAQGLALSAVRPLLATWSLPGLSRIIPAEESALTSIDRPPQVSDLAAFPFVATAVASSEADLGLSSA